MKKFIKILGCLVISLAIVLLFLNKDNFKSSASSSVTKNIKISMFQKITDLKTTTIYSGLTDTPEGLCVYKNTLYTTKIHSDGTTSIIKTIYTNGTAKQIMPEKNLNIAHANDLTYYNGYIYVAGLNNKFYRIKDNGQNSNGLEKYSVKTYSVSGASLSTTASKYSSASWNITHFTGKYFIFCSSINSSLKLTFRIGYFDDTSNTFIVKKTFYGKAKAFTTLQGLTYHNGYLYQTTSDNGVSGNMNKISEFNIGSSYSNITNQSTYSLAYYGTFDDLNLEKFEIESLDFNDNNQLYVIVNVKGTNDPLYVSTNPIN